MCIKLLKFLKYDNLLCAVKHFVSETERNLTLAKIKLMMENISPAEV